MKYGIFIGGLLIGAVATAITLLSTGWMVSSSLAETMQERAAHRAVKAELSEICVAQFEADPVDRNTILEAMESRNDVQRRDYVAENGWATMPGADRSEAYVASECADRIMKNLG